MKKVIVAMMAVSMMASAALADSSQGSVQGSIDVSKAITGLSTGGIQLSIDGTRVVSRGIVARTDALTGASLNAIGAVAGVSIEIAEDSINSDSSVISLLGKGVKLSIKVSRELLKSYPRAAKFILTRTTQGAYVLAVGLGNSVIDTLQLDLPDALIGLLVTPVAVLEAMANNQDETRMKAPRNFDK